MPIKRGGKNASGKAAHGSALGFEAQLWAVADQLRGAMNADDFRSYMLAFLFLRSTVSR